MKRSKLAGAFVSALALSACAADPLPDAAIVTTVARPKPPALLHVEGATLDPKPESKKDDRGPWGDDVAWRSQGAGAIMYGTGDGVLLVSAAHGVEGFFRTPATLGALRWGGFGKNDAVLLVLGTKLVRAASIADALAGKFVELPPTIDPSHTVFASNGDVFVAGAAEGAYFESTDGGKTLKKASVSSKEQPLLQLVVRDDGLILAALETSRRPGKYGGTTIHAQTWTKTKPGAAWKKGALVEGHEPRLVDLSGAVVEAIRITNDADFDTDTGTAVALDAKGAWIPSGWTPPWLQLWPSPTFEPTPPASRPAMPKVGAPEDTDMLVGGLMGNDCSGVACLSHREYLAPPPHGYVLDDANCDASAVVDRPEEVEDGDAAHAKHTIHRDVCDEKKPAARTATLVVTGAGVPKTFRLPAWCASGMLTGSDAWPLVHCDTRYGGKGVLVAFDESGTFTEVGPLAVAAGWRHEAERSADGTTVVTTEGAFALCDPKARRCTAIGKDGSILAARPLDGGRAIVAALGSSANVVKLSLVGAAPKALADVAIEGNLLDYSVTSDGNVRLVTDARVRNATGRGPKSKTRRSWLVREDGSLVPDERL